MKYLFRSFHTFPVDVYVFLLCAYTLLAERPEQQAIVMQAQAKSSSSEVFAKTSPEKSRVSNGKLKGALKQPIDSNHQHQHAKAHLETLHSEVSKHSDALSKWWEHESVSYDGVEVYEQTRLPIPWEYVFPLVLLLFLASIPVIERWLSGVPTNVTEQVLALLLWIALCGGVILFTGFLKFSSSHWKEPRSLSPVECAYFMVVSMTTVGYGDIYPAHAGAKLFVGMYVFLSLFVCSYILSDVLGRLYKALKIFEDDARSDQESSFPSHGLKPLKDIASPSFRPVLRSLGLVIFFMLTWSIFFCRFEGWSYTDGIYDALISMSTVGYGSIVPTTELGMAFAAVWLIFGTTSMVFALGEFATWLTKRRICDDLRAQILVAPEAAFDKFVKLAHESRLSEGQFILAYLWQKNRIDENDIRVIQSAWASLDPQDGFLSLFAVTSVLKE